MSVFKRILISALAIPLLTVGVAVIPVSAEHEEQGLEEHCPDHNGHEGKVNNPAFPSSTQLEVDGQEVNVNVSADGKSVTFTDENDDPIVVEFCIKAGPLAGGKQEGSSGSVTWVNHGGQTPEISYVVVYSVVEEEPEDPEVPVVPVEEDEDEGEVLGGAVTVTPTGGVDAGAGSLAGLAGLGASAAAAGYGIIRLRRR